MLSLEVALPSPPRTLWRGNLQSCEPRSTPSFPTDYCLLTTYHPSPIEPLHAAPRHALGHEEAAGQALGEALDVRDHAHHAALRAEVF